MERKERGVGWASGYQRILIHKVRFHATHPSGELLLIQQVPCLCRRRARWTLAWLLFHGSPALSEATVDPLYPFFSDGGVLGHRVHIAQ